MDFVSAEGAPLVESSIRQILGTEPGDLPWNPSFGGGLARFRNQNMTDDLAAAAQAQVHTAISRFEPRAHVKKVDVTRSETKLQLVVSWVLVEPGSRGASGVIAGPFSTTVEV